MIDQNSIPDDATHVVDLLNNGFFQFFKVDKTLADVYFWDGESWCKSCYSIEQIEYYDVTKRVLPSLLNSYAAKNGVSFEVACSMIGKRSLS